MIVLFRRMFHLLKQRGHIRKKNMELHERLREARKNAEMSVKKVAAELDVTRVQIWRMEKNADFISVGRLKKLAELYGLPIQSFFADDLDISDSTVSYQLIGMAITAAEQVANSLPIRPEPDALKAAIMAVIRTQQKRWADDPARQFQAKEFLALIEENLTSGTGQ